MTASGEVRGAPAEVELSLDAVIARLAGERRWDADIITERLGMPLLERIADGYRGAFKGRGELAAEPGVAREDVDEATALLFASGRVTLKREHGRERYGGFFGGRLVELPLPRAPVQTPAASLVELAPPAPPLLLELAIAEPADRHPAAVYLASLGSEKSRASQRSALEAIARELGAAGGDLRAVPWPSLRYQHVSALRSRFAGRFAPATANRYLSALRGVLRQAKRLGLMSAEDCASACDVDGVKGSRELAGRAHSSAELLALFRACDVATNAGARDAALLALLYGAGLRRAEAVQLDLANVDEVTGALRVLGKGNKERITYAPPGALRALRAWLVRRGAEPGPLLWPVDKADRMKVARLSDRAAARVLERAADRAGVKDVTCHNMRRTMISDLLDAGGDIATVQKMAGHAQVNTTARYDRRGERAKVRTAELLQVPFEG